MSKVESFLLFLLICLLPSQLSTHYWIPGLNFPRSDYLSFSVYVTDTIALSILLIRVISGRLQLFKRIRVDAYPVKVITLLILANVVFSLFPLLSAFKWFQLLLYIVLFSEFDWTLKFNLRLLITALSVSLFWVSCLALAQSLLAHSVGGLLYWLGERPLTLNSGLIAKIDLWHFGPTLRAYATFPHPNALAGYILVSLATVFIINRSLSFITSKLIRGLIVISLLGLVSTFSFSAFLVAGLSLLAFSTGHKYSAFNKAKIALLLLSLAVVLVFTLRPISILDRLYQLPNSLLTIAKRPLTGTGLGVFVLGSAEPISQFGSFYQPVHNAFLLFLAEMGLGGIIVLSYLFKKVRTFKPTSFSSALLIPLFIIATLGLFDHYWLTSHSNLILVVLLLVINYQKNVRHKTT